MNKLGIVLDLESRKGKQNLHKLIQRADVLVETLPDSSLKPLDWSFHRKFLIFAQEEYGRYNSLIGLIAI